MISLPLYIIEHNNGHWELYRTTDCNCWTFETKEAAERKLKKLCK